MITLQLKVEEVNYILNVIGQRPFVEVVELVKKITEQGASQVKDGDK